MSKEKTYINGMYIQKKSSDWGEFIKITFKADALQQLKDLMNEKGVTRIIINERREADKYGNTHYAVLDTWQPEKKKEEDEYPEPALEKFIPKETEQGDEEEDGLPF